MLNTIGVENFKAFGKLQKIPIRPLTLIYGANSSGKSSIIHSLLLACHAQSTGELDAHHTKIGGDAVDLGGFRQYVHRRNVAHLVEMTLEFDANNISDSHAYSPAPSNLFEISLAIGIARDNQGHPELGAFPRLQRYELKYGNQSVLRMSLRSNGLHQLDNLNYEHPIISETLQERVRAYLGHESEFLISDYSEMSSVIEEFSPEFYTSEGKFLPNDIIRRVDFQSDDLHTQWQRWLAGNHDVKIVVTESIRSIVIELIRRVNLAVDEELGRIKYLGPLRSFPPRFLAVAQPNSANWFAGGGYAWDVIRSDSEIRRSVNDWLSANNRLQTPYKLIVRDLIEIDQFGDLLLGMMGKEDSFEREDLSAVMENLYEEIRSSEIDKFRELVLVDKRSNTKVSHRDVGIGVSQVLPVLVGAYASRNSVIAIEQPEIHLHPALQADLGDVFIESAMGENRNRFLIETHSEHLLLRIMRRMRETCNQEIPDGLPSITSKDVCVLFIEPRGSSSIVRHIELDDEGQLLDPWPGGFFEEGFRERFS